MGSLGAWVSPHVIGDADGLCRMFRRSLHMYHVDEGGLDIQDIDDLQVLDSRFAYCGFGAILGPAGEHGVRNLLIRGCTLAYGGHYYRGGDGSHRPYDRPDGFGIEPSAGPIVIEDTVAAHNYGDGLDSKAAHTTIRRCVVANNACDGVKLWGGAASWRMPSSTGVGTAIPRQRRGLPLSSAPSRRAPHLTWST